MNKKILLYVMLMSSTSLQAQISVSNAKELEAISENLAGHYILTGDITLSEEWTPIGQINPFNGILDGNGYTIKNLRINNTDQSAVGFFAKTDGAQIRNVNIENAEVTAGKEDATSCAGILIGEAKSTTITNSSINEGFVNGKGSTGSFIGKVTRGSSSSILKDSYSTANVLSGLANAGGLVGTADGVSITNAYFAGTAETKQYICGGIIGSSIGNNSVSSCVVLSPYLKGVIVNRIVGENTQGKSSLSNNYARTDLKTGNRNLAVVPVNQTYIKGLQGENVPYLASGYVSEFPSYTEADMNTALSALNTYYYSTTRKLYFVKYTRTGNVSAIWTQAIFWDMAMNAYKRTGSSAHKKLMDDLFEGNRQQYANYDWDNGTVWFIYDDIMWWVIALARAYELTNDAKYLELSESGFERVWSGSKVLKDNGSYDPVNGGMYWAWDQQNPAGSPLPTMGKMACINYPTVIAAMTLFNTTKDASYFNKAKEIYLWSRNNLFDKEIGRVADSKHGTGAPAWVMHVYNQATCIGAAVMLYKATGDRQYLEDAVLAANYTKNQMSTNGFMNFETGVEQGIYHAIFAQYIIRLIEDGEQYQYLPWLRYNINAGWANRLATNITYKDYGNPAPAISQIESYDASGIPALMQVIPAAEKMDQEVRGENRLFYEKNLNWDFDTTWTIPENDSLPRLISSKTLGIQQTKTDKSMAEIYSKNRHIFVSAPNPVTAEIYDARGKLFVKKKIVPEEGIELPSGLYIVRTYVDTKSVIQKVINR